jgi:hypothetical protein
VIFGNPTMTIVELSGARAMARVTATVTPSSWRDRVRVTAFSATGSTVVRD